MRSLFLFLLLGVGCHHSGDGSLCSTVMRGEWIVPDKLVPLLDVDYDSCMHAEGGVIIIEGESNPGPAVSCSNDRIELEGYGMYRLSLDGDGNIRAYSKKYLTGFELEPC